MRPTVAFTVLCLVPILSIATAQTVVFFEEEFDGPALEPAIWHTEILTSGVRWCDSYPTGGHGPGTWVDEGEPCYGTAIHSPYGSAVLSESQLHMSSSNPWAFPYLVSRHPGSVQLFPTSGDFVLKVRMRYDANSAGGVGVEVLQTETTEPSGANPPETADDGNILLHVWCDRTMNYVQVATALEGELIVVAIVPSPDEFHEIALECMGTTFTIAVDGQPVYGPVSSALRPAAIWAGNPSLTWWEGHVWSALSIDYLRVEFPAPVPAAEHSWGAMKAMFRNAGK